jgi:signal transduction histidine kinase
LRKLNKRKDEFLNFSSHELKNPVASAKAYAQLLERQLRKTSDNSNADLAAKINFQIDRITNLINDLMDISKIEAGMLSFNLTEFDADELVSRTVSDLKMLSNGNKILLKGKCGVRLYADKERLNQVLTNFITNALKYSPSGSDIITEIKKDRDVLIFSVKDFGMGIPKDKQDEVFNKYFRTEDGERKADGLGLGLYISKKIIESHNGSIWLESEEGKGSTFYFSVPLK